MQGILSHQFGILNAVLPSSRVYKIAKRKHDIHVMFKKSQNINMMPKTFFCSAIYFGLAGQMVTCMVTFKNLVFSSLVT